MHDKRHVALLIETATAYGRDLLSGIVRYMHTHDDWSIFLEQRDLAASPPAWLNRWRGHGIISRATNSHLAQAVEASGIPLVELTDRGENFGFPTIRSNDHEIGRQGAKHLVERGYRHFAFCSFEREAWSARRLEGFSEFVQEAGFRVQSYESRWHESPWGMTQANSWEVQQRGLTKWVQSLPQPVGIMACNDVRGQHILDVCSLAEISAPEQVAVIGVDNDRLLCELCNPSLSSVIPHADRIGYLAAETLDRLMQGKSAAIVEHVVDPVGIATRQSTDTVAIDDAPTAAAVRFIREHACRGISVRDVLDNASLSRSSLERRFRKYLDRSPQQEIRNVQLKRVKQLLTETTLPIERIADLCGFEHAEYMHVVFKRELGQTPGQFRQELRTS
jgi:LacI family transcriptional regulator